MKMKLLIGVGVLSSCLTIPSFARDNPYDNNNEDSNRGYESSFGNRYEYDLSRPSDRIRYEVDPAAQLRDSIDVSPSRELERDLGQYGGGVDRD